MRIDFSFDDKKFVKKITQKRNKNSNKIKPKMPVNKLIGKIRQKKASNKQKRLERVEKSKEKSVNPYEKAHIEWIAPELERHERGTIWKIVMVGLFTTTVVLAFIFDAWTFSLALIAFAISYYLIHLEHPEDLKVKISDLGIKVGNRQYPFSSIKAFWILYEPGQIKTLNIKTTDQLVKDIAIQLENQDPAEVREFLLTKIPELEGQKEKLSDIFLRLFKIS